MSGKTVFISYRRDIAGKAFEKTLADLQRLIEQDLAALEERMEQAGAPWTPGRVPRWEME